MTFASSIFRGKAPYGRACRAWIALLATILLGSSCGGNIEGVRCLSDKRLCCNPDHATSADCVSGEWTCPSGAAPRSECALQSPTCDPRNIIAINTGAGVATFNACCGNLFGCPRACEPYDPGVGFDCVDGRCTLLKR